MVVVHKFGGQTLLASSPRGHLAALEILRQPDVRPTTQQQPVVGPGYLPSLRRVVIVSALHGVTDELMKIVDLALAQNATGYEEALGRLVQTHVVLARQLVDAHRVAALEQRMQADSRDILDVLQAISLAQQAAGALTDLIVAHGELWSAQLFSAFLQASGSVEAATAYLDARAVLAVEPDPHSDSPQVDWHTTKQSLDVWISGLSGAATQVETIVITGYIARESASGATTTLKRKGSDYSASIFGALFHATEITLWTDFDGIKSADLDVVKGAYLLGELTYAELIEYSFHGSHSVVHPKTMVPALAAKIPIRIRNSFNLACQGTLIHVGDNGVAHASDPSRAVRSFVTRSDIAMVTIQGARITIGDYTPLQEQHTLLRTIRNDHIPVYMIMHAAAENILRLCVPHSQADQALSHVKKHYTDDLQSGRIVGVQLEKGYAILTAIGDSISRTAGVAARFFTALHRGDVNVHSIAQNGERVISCLIASKALVKATQAVHSAFRLHSSTLTLALVGGTVAEASYPHRMSALLERIQKLSASTFEVCAIAWNNKMLLSSSNIVSSSWLSRFESESVPLNMSAFLQHVTDMTGQEAAIVDCSISREMASLYHSLLSTGFHVVTSNVSSLLASGPQLHELEMQTSRYCMMDEALTTAFPIGSLLKDSLGSENELIKLKCMFSTPVVHALDSVNRYLESGGEAPLDDLARDLAQRCSSDEFNAKLLKDAFAGVDAARKLSILGRMCGVDVTFEDIEVEKLAAFDPTVGGDDDDEGNKKQWRRIAEDLVARSRLLLSKPDCVVRYVAQLDASGNGRVSLESIPVDDPLASTSPGDVFCAIYTAQHHLAPILFHCPVSVALQSSYGRNLLANCLEIAARIRPQ